MGCAPSAQVKPADPGAAVVEPKSGAPAAAEKKADPPAEKKADPPAAAAPWPPPEVTIEGSKYTIGDKLVLQIGQRIDMRFTRKGNKLMLRAPSCQ